MGGASNFFREELRMLSRATSDLSDEGIGNPFVSPAFGSYRLESRERDRHVDSTADLPDLVRESGRRG